MNVDATSLRRIDVHTTSFLRHVPAGLYPLQANNKHIISMKRDSLFYSFRNGKNVSTEEKKLFVSIFKIAGDGKSINHFFEDDGEDTLSIYGRLYQVTLMEYCNVVRELITGFNLPNEYRS